jgi:hypothetical protein
MAGLIKSGRDSALSATERSLFWHTMHNWIKFFASTIESIQEPLTTILAASGCREGWIQGELFRAGRPFDVRVNEYALGGRRTADVSSGEVPDMLAEIKIVGANYYPKMQGYIESDVERMREVSTPGTQCFLILIIPRSVVKTKLGEYLHACSFSSECFEREWPGFKLRIWKF